MTVIDTIAILMRMDPKGVQTGMKQAEGFISSGIKSIMGLLTPFAGAFSLGALTKQYLTGADAVGKFSDALGLNVEEVQAWGEATARAGGTTQGFQGSLQSLTDKLADLSVKGTSEIQPFFDKLGISATSAGGKIKSAFDFLPDLAAAFEKMSKAESMGIGKKLGLDTGTIMLLQSGKKATEELVKRQKELGVYTKQDAELAAKANDAFADLGQAFTAVAAIAARVIVPALTWTAEAFTTLAIWVRKNETFITAFVTGLAIVIGATLTPILWAMAKAAWAAIAPFLPFIAIIALVALLIDDFVTYLNGGKSALEYFGHSAEEGTAILEGINAAWENFKDALGNGLDTLLGVALQVSNFLWGIWDVLVAISKIIFGVFTFDANLVLEGFEDILGAIKEVWDWLGRVGEAFKSFTLGFANFFGYEENPDYQANMQESTDFLLSEEDQAYNLEMAEKKKMQQNLTEATQGLPLPSNKAYPELVAGGANNVTNNATSTTTVQNMNIVTQATDAQGIANGMSNALQNSFPGLAYTANSGVNQK